MTINVPQYAVSQVQTFQWVKNGTYPDAWWQSVLSQEANKAVAWRTKELASFSVPIPSIPASDGTRSRWRWAAHSSTHVSFIWVRFVMATGSLTAGAGALPTGDLHGKLTVADGGGTIGTAEMHFGATLSPPGDAPNFFGTGTAVLHDGVDVAIIPPDTDLFGVFSDETNGRIISATVFETSLEPTTANGYLEGGQTLFSPIYDEDPGDLTTLLRAAWKAGAAPAWLWAVKLESAPRTRSTATYVNLIDNASTSLTDASTGATLDETNRARISEAALGVPVTIWVYAKQPSGSAGKVKVLEEGGDSIEVTIDSVSFGGHEGWYSQTGYLTDVLQKIDLQFKGNGTQTTSVWAVAIVPYQA